ncbi:MAG TPA: class I SAM-dependent methyltransferase [Phnomibacter sp.]|nr:class I SAM-dependent methyltransferase [Phnomibacter sp.]
MLIERANAGLHDYIWQHLIEVLPLPNSVLDIGSGTGAWLQRFQQKQVRVLMGVDLDTTQFAIEGIPTKALNFDTYQGEIFGSYALITCLELMEHLENPGLLMDMIQKNLAPGGCCILSTPNIHSRNARLRYALKGELGHFDTKSDPTHIYPVYTANLQKLLERRNMKITSIHAFPKGSSLNYNRPVRWLAQLLSPMMRTTYEGDNIIYLIQHNHSSQP